MSKMMSPKTRIDWITDPTYDPLLPKVTLFTDATNISCAIEAGYTLNPTDSKTDASVTICDDNNAVVLTSYNYEGSLTIFRDADLEETTTAFAKAWAFFEHKDNVEGYLVRRVGKLSSAGVLVADVVSSFKLIADDPIDVVEEDAPIKATIGFFKQGRMELYKPVVA